MPRGGARVGAGRKRKTLEQKVLEGSASVAERRRASRSEVPAASGGGSVTVPAGMNRDQAAVWRELAPHALAAGTLTRATAFAFRALVELIVLRRDLLKTITREGWQRTVNGIRKKHPLATEHRGLLMREEAGLARFCVSPMGKEMEQPGPPAPAAEGEPVDPFAQFDGTQGDTAHH